MQIRVFQLEVLQEAWEAEWSRSFLTTASLGFARIQVVEMGFSVAMLQHSDTISVGMERQLQRR